MKKDFFEILQLLIKTTSGSVSLLLAAVNACYILDVRNYYQLRRRTKQFTGTPSSYAIYRICMEN